MEKFKSGDKVKFLNEKGGGTVVRLIDSRMALVSIEDGFEIPVLMSDLVIDPASAEARVKQATEVIREEVLRQEPQHAVLPKILNLNAFTWLLCRTNSSGF